jgi:hypothetical protein
MPIAQTGRAVAKIEDFMKRTTTPDTETGGKLPAHLFAQFSSALPGLPFL